MKDEVEVDYPEGEKETVNYSTSQKIKIRHLHITEVETMNVSITKITINPA